MNAMLSLCFNINYRIVHAHIIICVFQYEKFQLDGNMGYLAALCESLLQSHVPGHLVLLPSLPYAMALEGGSVEGLRARGNAVVSISWAPFNRLKDLPIQSSKNITKMRVSVGQVQRATVLFRAPHPWFGTPDKHTDSKGSFVEDIPGFFTLLQDPSILGVGARAGDGGQSKTGSASAHVSNVIIVYPSGSGVLHLVASSLVRGRSAKETDSTPQTNCTTTSTSTTTSAGTFNGGLTNKEVLSSKSSAGRGRVACARAVPSLSSIPSANITISANPLNHATTISSNSPGAVNRARVGLGIQIFSFPCKVYLRTL